MDISLFVKVTLTYYLKTQQIHKNIKFVLENPLKPQHQEEGKKIPSLNI